MSERGRLALCKLATLRVGIASRGGMLRKVGATGRNRMTLGCIGCGAAVRGKFAGARSSGSIKATSRERNPGRQSAWRSRSALRSILTA